VDRDTGTPGFSAAYIDENGPMKNITTNTIKHVHIYINKYTNKSK
jgi:hypothetical protein